MEEQETTCSILTEPQNKPTLTMNAAVEQRVLSGELAALRRAGMRVPPLVVILCLEGRRVTWDAAGQELNIPHNSFAGQLSGLLLMTSKKTRRLPL